jgi:hypothetical protein
MYVHNVSSASMSTRAQSMDGPIIVSGINERSRPPTGDREPERTILDINKRCHSERSGAAAKSRNL